MATNHLHLELSQVKIILLFLVLELMAGQLIVLEDLAHDEQYDPVHKISYLEMSI